MIYASQETKDFIRNNKDIQKVLKDNRLSFKAIGLYTMMYGSNKDTFSIYELMKYCSDGIDSTRAGINELIKYKYISAVEEKLQYVYLITFDEVYFKIGKSDALHNRLKTYETCSPIPVKVISTIITSDMGMLERQLLKRFNHKKVKGEWFKLDAEDVEYIKLLEVSSNG